MVKEREKIWRKNLKHHTITHMFSKKKQKGGIRKNSYQNEKQNIWRNKIIHTICKELGFWWMNLLHFNIWEAKLDIWNEAIEFPKEEEEIAWTKKKKK